MPLFQIFSDPEAMRYWSTLPHQRLEQTEDYVRKTIEATQKGEGDDFVIVYKGEVVGKAGLWNNREIGFFLSPGLWGQGLGSEAVRAVMEHAKEKGVEKILADVDPRNERSLSLLKKRGFVEIGRAQKTIQVGDEWVDSVYLEARL